MAKDEILVVKKKGNTKMKFKVCDKNKNSWTPKRYEKIIPSKDYNLLAYLFYDLYSMGYPVEKAHLKFKDMLSKPDLFFL